MRPVLIAFALALAVTGQPTFAGADSTPEPTQGLPPAQFFGKLELSPGVPCAGCTVVLEGTPLSAVTDDAGLWTRDRIPPGVWTIKATHPSFGSTRFHCNASSGEGTACASAVIARPGGASGRITFGSTGDYDTAVIGVPELGVYTQINCGGGYLLTGVAPGWRKLVVTTELSSKEHWVYINPGQITTKQNITFLSAVPTPTR